MAKGRGFGGGFGGGMNMQAMMKQAQKMQENMMKAQEEIAQMETTGTAGGGMVTATVTGTSTLKSIEIKPDVVDPDDIDMLQDLVVAAVNEALKAANEKSQSQMSAITGGMGGGLAACSDGLFRTTRRAADRGICKAAWHRPENRAAAGLSCARPAQGGRGALCGRDPRGQGQDVHLRALPEPDRQRDLSDLRRPEPRSEDDLRCGRAA